MKFQGWLLSVLMSCVSQKGFLSLQDKDLYPEHTLEKLSPLNWWEARWELEEVTNVMGKRLLLRKWRITVSSDIWGGCVPWALSPGVLPGHVQRLVRTTQTCTDTERTSLQGTSFLPRKEEPKVLLRSDPRLVQEAGGRQKPILTPLDWFSSFYELLFFTWQVIFLQYFPAGCRYQLIKALSKWRQDLVSLHLLNKLQRCS